jgi:hypothetical protein
MLFKHRMTISANLSIDGCLVMYPAPESNRHGFPQVFETSASTNSASWALATTSLEAGCKCIQTLFNSQQIFLSVVNICNTV